MEHQTQKAPTVAVIDNTPTTDAPATNPPAVTTDNPAKQEVTNGHDSNSDTRSPFEQLPPELKQEIMNHCDCPLDRLALAYIDRDYYYAYLEFHAQMNRLRDMMPVDPDDDD